MSVLSVVSNLTPISYYLSLHTCLQAGSPPTCLTPYLSMASLEDHASTGVPPQSVATRPMGRLICWYRYFPYSQQTAEKYDQSEWPTASVNNERMY